MGKKESKIERYLVEQANNRHFSCFKTKALGQRGFPDRLLVAKGLSFYIECKAPDEKPRASQLLVLHGLKSATNLVFVIDSKEQIDALFSYIDLLPNTPHYTKTYTALLETFKSLEFQ